ncbi:MAG: uroporphyrinogen decarboxylase family protein [Candidatus Magnetomorum sp.]|nr:uroporphyrinogen decarboxylase family protein [Candidatus Magnetomorum sp.]
MSQQSMSSLNRVLTTLSHKEPDRVPFFLLVTMHGAKALGLSIKDYFSSAKNVVEGQIRMQKKFRHDCIYTFFYAPIEIEAWGGEVIYSDNGPPNSGTPFIQSFDDIKTLHPPDVRKAPCLQKVLNATHMLKGKIGDEAPIIGVVMSPFSLPVMQMGFDRYFLLMHEHPDLFDQLMKINQEFCVNWANAQLDAGATAICYFDPVSSSTITTRKLYLNTGYQIACATLPRINGPTATHMASGRCIPILDDIAKTGTGLVGVSSLEPLEKIKSICKGKLTVVGNLNGIEMRRWDTTDAEIAVKATIQSAAPGGGFILSDNHGEIPWEITDDVLLAISHAVHQWGTYPILHM